MSLDLKDLKRIKLTPETLVWLEAESRTTGRGKQEILRDAMHKIALEKHQFANVLSALALAEGLNGAVGGRSR